MGKIEEGFYSSALLEIAELITAKPELNEILEFIILGFIFIPDFTSKNFQIILERKFNMISRRGDYNQRILRKCYKFLITLLESKRLPLFP